MILLQQHRVRFFAIASAIIFLLLFLYQQLGCNGRPIEANAAAPRNALLPDFAQFYVAGQFAVENRLDQLYNAEEFWKRTQTLLGVEDTGYFFVYPPFVAQLCKPLTAFPYATAAWLYFFATLALALWLGYSIASHFFEQNKSIAWTACWLLIGSVPFWRCATFGQNGVISLGLVWLFYRLWQSAHYRWAGLALALTLYKPQLFLGLYFWLLLFGPSRVRAWFVVGVIGVLWLSSAPPPMHSMALWGQWIEALRALCALPEYPAWMHSFYDLMHAIRRTCGAGNDIYSLWPQLVAWALVAGLWAANLIEHRLRNRHALEVEHMFGLALAGSLILAPRLYQYDLLMLYPLLVGWWAEEREDEDPRNARAAVRGIAAIYLAAFVSDCFASADIPLLALILFWIFLLFNLRLLFAKPLAPIIAA